MGSTREEIIARYGQPKAVLSSGPKEILTYPKGSVELEGGRVTRIELPAPKGAPGAPKAPVAKAKAPAPPAAFALPANAKMYRSPRNQDVWFTDYAAAQYEAGASRRRILALFTGSDWCPGCIAFENDVAHHPDFLAFTRARFVLLKLDYPTHHALPQDLAAQNEKLRQHFAINQYPSLIIMNPDGGSPVPVEIAETRDVKTRVEFFIEAVDEARQKGT